jgi:tetratricopeptide (TPR) repeat protein
MRPSPAPVVEEKPMRGRLGPYDILAPLGAGGMGEVFRARDRRLDRLVAIKVIKTAHHDDPRARERFDREAKAIASLDHPHICSLYDVGHDDGVDYFVMQYLEGETLASRLHGGPLPIADALKYGSQIAHAIDTAHKRGITHRDLKPSNVMLTKTGAVLLDFGLAKLSEAPDSSNPATTIDLTREGAIVGTVRYMAPEILEHHAADARSDLFSFGAILYEMITGRRAFEGDSDARAMVSILHDQPKPLRAWRADVPPELQQIVDGCLAKDPEDRWETARDVARQIDSIAPSHTTTPLPISSGTLRLYRTQPRWLAAAVMVGAMGAAGTGVLLSRYAATVTAPPPPYLVALPCRAADLARQAFCDGFNEALLGRLSRLTLGQRLQVAPRIGWSSGNVATVNEARIAGATLVMDSAADERSVVYSLYAADGTTTNFNLETEDVFDAEERAIFWVLRVLAISLDPVERVDLLAQPTQRPDARSAFLEGRGHLRSNNPDAVEAAAASFDKAIDADPAYAQAYFGSGMVWRTRFQRDHDVASGAAALDACGAAVQKEPALSEGFTCLGMILFDQRKFEAAAGEFARALQLDKSNDEAIQGLGDAQEELGRPADAERTYLAAIESRPGYFRPHVWAANFYRGQSRYDDAGRELESAIALVPRSGPLHAALVPPLAYSGKYDEALAAAEKSISIAPSRQGFVAKAGTLFRMRRFEEAAAAAENARKIASDSTLLTALARSYYWMGTIESRSKALALYREAAIDLETGSTQASNPLSKVDRCLSLAEIYARLERPDDARAQLQLAGIDPASTTRPRDSHQLFFAAQIYAQIGDSEKAIRWLESAIYWGVPPAELRAWPELDGLRNQPGFRALETANSKDSRR